jgi:hypothetical protein
MDVMAVTGPLPDRDAWAEAVGPALAPYTVDWEPWEVVDVSPGDFWPGWGDDEEEGEEREGGETRGGSGRELLSEPGCSAGAEAGGAAARAGAGAGPPAA